LKSALRLPVPQEDENTVVYPGNEGFQLRPDGIEISAGADRDMFDTDPLDVYRIRHSF
jgi:hypothetical protein